MVGNWKLDERICDIEGGENTQTYREFIVESETEFEFEHKDLDNMSFLALSEYMEFLDYLWTK